MDEVFSTPLTPARMAEVMRSFERDHSIQNPNLRRLPPDPAKGNETFTFLGSPTQLQSTWQQMMEEPQYPPPTTLPCANVQAEKYAVCESPGTMACSACKLVSYCSQVNHKSLLLSLCVTERLS